MKTLMEMTAGYLREVISFCSQVGQLRAEGEKMRQILSLVPGRPSTEDKTVRIDQVCEDIFRNHLKKCPVRIKVLSEHGTFGDENPQYFCALDPFDGSGIFRRGLVREFYSALTFFDLRGEPVCGGTADILQQSIYLASPQGVVHVPSEGVAVKISVSRKRKLDGEAVIAAYLMNFDYLRDWEKKTRKLGDKFPGLLVWPNGSSCIYHYIASGQVHAYVMFKGPRSEIDPGLAFAKFSPFPVVSVKEHY